MLHSKIVFYLSQLSYLCSLHTLLPTRFSYTRLRGCPSTVQRRNSRCREGDEDSSYDNSPQNMRKSPCSSSRERHLCLARERAVPLLGDGHVIKRQLSVARSRGRQGSVAAVRDGGGSSWRRSNFLAHGFALRGYLECGLARHCGERVRSRRQAAADRLEEAERESQICSCGASLFRGRWKVNVGVCAQPYCVPPPATIVFLRLCYPFDSSERRSDETDAHRWNPRRGGRRTNNVPLFHFFSRMIWSLS